jgi:hypothetical protein
MSVVIRAMQRRRNMGGLIRPIPEVLNGNICDLCLANILVLPLVALAPMIAQLVRSPGGEIGLSGVCVCVCLDLRKKGGYLYVRDTNCKDATPNTCDVITPPGSSHQPLPGEMLANGCPSGRHRWDSDCEPR